MTDIEGLQNVIAAHGSTRNRLVIQLGEFEGRRLLNIRRWYVDSATRTWTPTRKGLSLQRDAFEFALRAVRDNEAAIQQWLSSEVDIPSKDRLDRERQVQLAAESGFASRPYEVKVEEWGAPQFFRVDGAGGKDVLVFNRSHPVGRRLADLGARLPDGLATMLLAFGRACRLVDGGADCALSDTLELLSANWGFILQQYGVGSAS